MASVTQRINQIKQPYGGYLNIKNFDIFHIDDGNKLNEKENINPSIVGLVVDYMSRFISGTVITEAFKISILGAMIAKQLDVAADYLNNITGLDDNSIFYACKMCGFDVAFRAGIEHFSDTKHINPNKDTIENIRIMINRSIHFFENFGPVIVDGFTFEGGYTKTINAGDGDFLTKDTLFDFKVSKNEPTTKYTLQILVYYIMGMHSIHSYFKDIANIGLFNPRLNKVYICPIERIDNDIINQIEKDVICY